jgi:hypothetical protein
MSHGALLLFLVVFLGTLFSAALLVWALWVRPYAKRARLRSSSPYSLTALVADFSTGLIYSRGRLPWFLRLFGLLLMLLASDLVLIVVVFLVRD